MRGCIQRLRYLLMPSAVVASQAYPWVALVLVRDDTGYAPRPRLLRCFPAREAAIAWGWKTAQAWRDEGARMIYLSVYPSIYKNPGLAHLRNVMSSDGAEQSVNPVTVATLEELVRLRQQMNDLASESAKLLDTRVKAYWESVKK